MYNPKQGDIVFLDFSPQSGHEQAGRRPGVVISNEQFFVRTKFAIVCPITNTSNKFPLHILLDNRTKTTGVILTEHMKCLDVISRNIQFVEKLPEDLLEKTLAYVKAFFWQNGWNNRFMEWMEANYVGYNKNDKCWIWSK